MNDSGNVTKDGQEDVDEEICTAATLKENTDGREEDGKNDLDDVAIRLSVICVRRVTRPAPLGASVNEDWGRTHDPVKAIVMVV